MDVRFADLANLSLVGAGAVSAGHGAGLPVELVDRARKGASQWPRSRATGQLTGACERRHVTSNGRHSPCCE